MRLPTLTFVLGGAASGKSAFAEAHVLRGAADTGRTAAYIATAQAFDAEMAAKIADHRAARGGLWHTIEAPLDVAAALATVPPDDPVLIDCATLWLSNMMHDGQDWAEAWSGLAAAIAARPGAVTIVSNEVGHGIVPENQLARQFRGAQGRLNQAIAAQSDLAVLVVAGLALVLKGALR